MYLVFFVIYVFNQVKKLLIGTIQVFSSVKNHNELIMNKFSSQNMYVSTVPKVRNFVIEGVACHPPLRRLQATPPLQTSLPEKPKLKCLGLTYNGAKLFYMQPVQMKKIENTNMYLQTMKRRKKIM